MTPRIRADGRKSRTGPKPTRKRYPWLEVRQRALTITCPQCAAPPGVVCIRPNGLPEYDRAAHLPRVEDTMTNLPPAPTDPGAR